MNDERSKALDELAKLSQEYEESENKYHEEMDSWWNNLSKEDQGRAFFSVVKRLVQGELYDRGTYRYVLYDVFGFDSGSYGMGMSCGFMELHNSIYTQEEMRELRDRELAAAGIEVKKSKVEMKNE